MTQSSLANHFLLPLPVQANTYFDDSVTLMVHHNEEGAMGFIINRPTPIKIVDVMLQAELSPIEEITHYIMEGGPVSRSSPAVIHSDDYNAEGTIQITDGVGFTTELTAGDILNTLKDIAAGKGPSKYLFLLGYAGWGPGQLEQELQTNSWISCPIDQTILFDAPFASRFKELATQIDLDFTRIAPHGGSA